MVCEEYKEVLVAAWENEQAEIEKKEKEVRIIFAASLLLYLQSKLHWNWAVKQGGLYKHKHQAFLMIVKKS